MSTSSPGAPATTEPALTVRDAVKIVAQGIAARAVKKWPEWENFPDIGEHDWHEVLAEIDAANPEPDTHLYLRAYALLAERAEDAP